MNSKLQSRLADDIGSLRSQIRLLQDKLKLAEGILKNDHIVIAEGSMFRVAISYDVSRSTTNWKKIALRFDPSHQMVSANTKVSTHDKVLVTALPTH